MLEAAALAIPPICFNRSGGGPEFVEADAGLVVGYADTLAVARGLVLLREQSALRRRLGVAARQKVMDSYQSNFRLPKF